MERAKDSVQVFDRRGLVCLVEFVDVEIALGLFLAFGVHTVIRGSPLLKKNNHESHESHETPLNKKSWKLRDEKH